MSNISDLLPLREPTFFILLSLSNNDKHGYAILKDVATLSSGRVQLSTSTLYEALARLLDQGLVALLLPLLSVPVQLLSQSLSSWRDSKESEPRDLS